MKQYNLKWPQFDAVELFNDYAMFNVNILAIPITHHPLCVNDYII